MGLGWVGAYGARGGAEAMAALREELMKRAIMEQQAQQQQFENQRALSSDALKRQQFEQGKTEFDATLGLNRDKLGFEQQQYTDAAPSRAANLRLTTAQAGRIENAPADAEAERAFAREMQGLKTKDEAGLIDKRISGQLRVAGASQARPQNPNWQIKEATDPATGQPVMVRINPDTNEAERIQLPGGLQPGGAKQRQVTGQERQTLNYFNRMLKAERDARAAEDSVGLWDSALSETPMVPDSVANFLRSEKGQQFVQAQRAFTEARLRKESGAAISNKEYDNDRTMNFKRAGDKPKTLKQKRAARLEILRGLGNSAGGALREFYGDGQSLDTLLQEFADQAPAPAAGGVVPMTAPDGRSLMVPADKVAELEARGAKRR